MSLSQIGSVGMRAPAGVSHLPFLLLSKQMINGLIVLTVQIQKAANACMLAKSSPSFSAQYFIRFPIYIEQVGDFEIAISIQQQNEGSRTLSTPTLERNRMQSVMP